ncbi:uncharacterized protein [Amphiura filiformis]|uniref:uncharacterized protein n=1 Tax=Amphiura filiformis TaxID=82378 RepID=UPI003B2163B9
MWTTGFFQVTCFWTAFLLYFLPINSEPTVTVTAPVNPVDEGAIFSIHCQVFNLGEGQEVTLLKVTGGRSQRLTLEGTIMVSDDRMFLAVRQLNDGSTVYFLSVIDARKSDDREYQCKIIDPAGDATNLPEKSVFIGVNYYPDSEPECAYNSPLVIPEGGVVSFNCSSVLANPEVDIQWIRTGSQEKLKSADIFRGDRKYSVVSFRTKLTDNNAVFLCEVSSLAFPDKTKSCHVGPLLITSKSGASDPNPDMKIDDPILRGNQDNDISFQPTLIAKRPPMKTEDCSKVCLSTKSLESKWILATIFTGCGAFIFLILGLALFVKYLNARSPYTRPRYIATPKPTADGIYSELECKRGDGKFYMTLQNKQRELTVGGPNVDSRSERYDPMPNVPKI